MINILFLIGGLAAIIIAANYLVDGASALAKRLGVSDLITGLTVVAFGTSAPELTVNIFSALEGSTDLAVGNVLGSNMANILLILGISAIIFPITVKHSTKWKEIPFALLAIIVFAVLANDIFIDKSDKNIVTRVDGIVLLLFMVVFLVYTFNMAMSQKYEEMEEPHIKQMKLSKSLLFILAGLVGLFFGGKYMVQGAVDIAEKLGMSQRVIGVTIVAIGTSLPELAASLVAAFKKKTDIAIGNVVGSNIFNVFFILGTTAVIKPLPFDNALNFDTMVTIFASILLFITTMTIGINKITRTEGIIFVLIYISYVTYSISS
jgi:cation:H+ antiporter